jgi:hypothetical protein
MPTAGWQAPTTSCPQTILSAVEAAVVVGKVLKLCRLGATFTTEDLARELKTDNRYKRIIRYHDLFEFLASHSSWSNGVVTIVELRTELGNMGKAKARWRRNRRVS